MTAPLLFSLLTGTALGSFLSRNTGIVYIGAGIYFMVALALGAMLLLGTKRGAGTACPACRPDDSETPMPEQSAQAAHHTSARIRR